MGTPSPNLHPLMKWGGAIGPEPTLSHYSYTPAIIRGGESIRQSHTIELHFILFTEQDLSLKCSAWKSFVSVMWQLWSKDVIVVVQWSISCVLKKQQLCPKDVTVVVQWSKSWCRNPWRQKNKIFFQKKMSASYSVGLIL